MTEKEAILIKKEGDFFTKIKTKYFLKRFSGQFQAKFPSF